ncbi:MAG: hypothetical protein U9O94_01515 [Nanoarchaeota archaeon]|nr:hypothetical protein [Nanoarchaeota archaeon]
MKLELTHEEVLHVAALLEDVARLQRDQEYAEIAWKSKLGTIVVSYFTDGKDDSIRTLKIEKTEEDNAEGS